MKRDYRKHPPITLDTLREDYLFSYKAKVALKLALQERFPGYVSHRRAARLVEYADFHFVLYWQGEALHVETVTTDQLDQWTRRVPESQVSQEIARRHPDSRGFSE